MISGFSEKLNIGKKFQHHEINEKSGVLTGEQIRGRAVTPYLSLNSTRQDWDIDKLTRGDFEGYDYSLRSGHPRLFITPGNKGEIVRRVSESELGRQLFQSIVNKADRIDLGCFKNYSSFGSSYSDYYQCIEIYGFIHQIGKELGLPAEEPSTVEHIASGFKFKHGLQKYREKGVEAITKLASLSVIHYNDLRASAFPVGYDWLYDALTSEQRKLIIRRLIELTQIWPIDPEFPSDSQRVGFGDLNSPGGMVFVNPLAFYGDGILLDQDIILFGTNYGRDADAIGKMMIEGILKKTLWSPTGSLTRREILFGGITDEEIGYTRRYDKFLPTVDAWRTATGQDFWQAGSFWNEWAKWMIYSQLPHNDNGPGIYYYIPMPFAMDPGDHFGDIQYQQLMGSSVGWLSRSGDILYAQVAAWMERIPASASNDASRFFYTVLMGDPFISPLSPKSAHLPTFYIFNGSIGRTYMLSEWGNSDATYAYHTASEYPCLRAHGRILNSIFIYKNGGPLLTTKKGFRHDYGPPNNYNVVIPYAPGEYSSQLPSDGGVEDCPGNNQIDNSKFVAHGGFTRAKIEPGKYGYSAGDASDFLKAYTFNYNQRKSSINSSDRQFVWFPDSGVGSDFFLILDRVTTDGVSVQPHIIFNTVGEPKVSKNFDTSLLGESRAIGHWVIKDAPSITIINTEKYTHGNPQAHAKLFFKTLLPNKVTIHKLGGLGRISTRMLTDRSKHRRIDSAGNGYFDFPVEIDATYATDIDDSMFKDGTSNSGDLNGLGTTAFDCELNFDVNKDRAPGVIGVDDDGDGLIDENSMGCGCAVNIDRLGAFEKIAPGCGTAQFSNGSLGYTITGSSCTYLNDRVADNDEDGNNGFESCDRRAMSGLWRFQIANQELQVDNLYLMAMEATDSSQAQPAGSIILAESESLVGAVVKDAMGLFNKKYENLHRGDIVMPSGVSGNYRILISDLTPFADYNLSIAGTTIREKASEAGTLFIQNIALSTGTRIQIVQIGAPIPPVDTVPPLVSSVSTSSPTTLSIIFNEAIEQISAQNKNNYAINSSVSIQGAVLSSDNKIVTLTTSAHPTGSYTVTISNVKDIAGNVISPISMQYSYTDPALCIDRDSDGRGVNCNLGSDCNDGNKSIYSRAPELCDSIDNQCSGDAGFGLIDENCPVCGNGAIDQGEICDLDDLDGESCFTQGFLSGELKCTMNGTSGCRELDTSFCSRDGKPILKVDAPENISYYNLVVPLKFIAIGADQCHLLINGAKKEAMCNVNDILRPMTTSRFGNGVHKLEIVANNSYGHSSKMLSFSVFYTRNFLVKYDKFHGKGETTNLSSLSDLELGEVLLVLHSPNKGKIEFLEKVNLTKDADSRNETDLDSGINISFARIEIDSQKLPGLNKRARLSFEQLPFSNPRVLKNGNVCGDCFLESYFQGTLRVNVSGFSVYTVEDIPASPPSGRPNAEGGGLVVNPRIDNRNLSRQPSHNTTETEEKSFDDEQVIPLKNFEGNIMNTQKNLVVGIFLATGIIIIAGLVIWIFFRKKQRDLSGKAGIIDSQPELHNI